MQRLRVLVIQVAFNNEGTLLPDNQIRQGDSKQEGISVLRERLVMIMDAYYLLCFSGRS